MNVAASSQIGLATATQYAHEAFATWNAVTCGSGGGPIAIEAKDAFGPVACDHIEYNVEGGNANVILFREDEWPYTGVGNTLALTTVTYDANTGEIHDADMEINGTNEFLQPGLKGIDDYDLLSIMTHEAGHFLGLAHTLNTEAVMQTTLSPHVVRTALSADDIAGICAIYPPGSPAAACDFAPIGGFSPLCGLDSINGGACESAGPPRRGDTGSSAWAAAALGLVPWIVRRARRPLRRRDPKSVRGAMPGEHRASRVWAYLS
jgi:hypothetical protein